MSRALAALGDFEQKKLDGEQHNLKLEQKKLDGEQKKLDGEQNNLKLEQKKLDGEQKLRTPSLTLGVRGAVLS